MRGLFFFVCFFVLGVSHIAEAQGVSEERNECSKGILWPFIRNAGDCLTEKEREAGMTGAYGESAAVLPGNALSAFRSDPNRGLLDDNFAAASLLTNNDTADDAEADEVASDQ